MCYALQIWFLSEISIGVCIAFFAIKTCLSYLRWILRLSSLDSLMTTQRQGGGFSRGVALASRDTQYLEESKRYVILVLEISD